MSTEDLKNKIRQFEGCDTSTLEVVLSIRAHYHAINNDENCRNISGAEYQAYSLFFSRYAGVSFVNLALEFASCHVVFDDDLPEQRVTLDMSAALVPLIKAEELADDFRGLLAQLLLDIMDNDRLQCIYESLTVAQTNVLDSFQSLITTKSKAFMDDVDAFLKSA
ncbi:MAG: hypothetical protein ACI9TY_000788 [Alphaproteobacteria bacterium]|jgi:hypothetical protein